MMTERVTLWQKFSHFIETAEKTEHDYLWENVQYLEKKLDTMQSELDTLKMTTLSHNAD